MSWPFLIASALPTKPDQRSPLLQAELKKSDNVKVKIHYSFYNEFYSDSSSCASDGHYWIPDITETINYYGATGNILFSEERIVSPAHCNVKPLQIFGFTITDATGKRFVFDQIETTSATPISGYVPQGSESVGNITDDQVNNFYQTTSAWHLSKIYAGPTPESKLLDIQFKNHLEQTEASIQTTTNYIDLSTNSISSEHLDNAFNQGVLKPEREVSFFYSTTNTLKPSKITFNDGTYVEIHTKPFSDHPETEGAIIKNLEVHDRKGQLVRDIEFQHQTTSTNNRLWLTGLQESNTNDSEILTHQFDYLNKSGLPGPHSVQDIWGFISQGTGQATGKSSDPIKKGLLTSITYPTGGKKEFEWEQHTFSYAGDTEISTDISGGNPNNWVTRTERVVIDGVNTPNGTFFFFPHDFTLPQLSNPRVRLIRFNTTPTNPLDTTSFDEWNATFRIIRDGDQEDVVFQERISDLRASGTLPGQGITQGNLTAGLMIPDLTGFTFDAEFFIYYDVLVESPTDDVAERWLYGGGPRIKEISFTDEYETQRKWSFSYLDVSKPTGSYSSGVIDGRFENYKPEYDLNVAHFLGGGSDVAP
ncbi:MAG: hypothetical protein AAF391_12835, partial [Bacteroidota bacterium]